MARRIEVIASQDGLAPFEGTVKYVDRNNGGKLIGMFSYGQMLAEAVKYPLEKVWCKDATICFRRLPEPPLIPDAVPLPRPEIYDSNSTAIANVQIGAYRQQLPHADVGVNSWGDRSVVREGMMANRCWSFCLSREFDRG